MSTKDDQFTRREVLEISTAVLVGGALVRCAGGDGEEPVPDDGAELMESIEELTRETPDVFPCGIQAGAMTSTSVILKTHHEFDLRLIVWRPAEDPGLVWAAYDEVLQPVRGVVTARVTGLGPAYYRYAFVSADGDYRSPVGRFRTAFAEDDLRPIRIAAATCTSLRNRPFVALDLASEEEPDLLLHLGDMSYNDGAATLGAYRSKWRATLGESEYQRVLRSMGYYLTWDDHEIDNNFDPETMPPHQLAAAKEAFFEALAVDRGENDRLWRSFRWGRTVEIFVVDSRSERLPSTRGSDTPVYISAEQMAWLKRGLRHSPCRFKLVMNSVPMTNMAEIWKFGAADTWFGYEAQRTELLDYLINEKVDGVVFLSGDFHCGFVGRLEAKGDASRFHELAVGPTGNGPNPLAVLAESGDLPVDEIFPRDQFDYFSSSEAVMTFIDLDPTEDRLFVRYVDAREGRYGQVLYEGTIDPFISE